MTDPWVGHLDGNFTDFNTKVLKSGRFGFLDFLRKSKGIQETGFDEIYLIDPCQLISLRNQLQDRFTKYLKFNTKVLNFDDFGNLEDLFRIEA